MAHFVQVDDEGRILVTTDNEQFSGPDMFEFTFPGGFDFSKQNDYRISDGELLHDPLTDGDDDDASQERALMDSQMQSAVSLLIKSAGLPRMQAVSVSSFYDKWSGKGIKYAKGDWLRHQGDLYYVETSHTSQYDWPPDVAASLFTRFKLAPDGVRIWEAPTRAENAFDDGERCHYPGADGPIYSSKFNGNTTVPGSDDRYWEEA